MSRYHWKILDASGQFVRRLALAVPMTELVVRWRYALPPDYRLVPGAV